ncbi:MAG: type-F conjugative transfer system pilin assembly protein TrbC [Alphaproteobacteria bacterium]|nr:type-F conjugative transfer system pilin assembly protein TrbC [Alphaproteobacteria bacterium]
MTRFRQGFIPVFMVASFLAAGWSGTLRAEEMPRSGTPDGDAARLVEEVLRKAGESGEDSLGPWSRSILDRALKRAGETARQSVPGSGGAGPGLRAGGAGPGSAGPPAAPLPAERHAGSLAGNAAGRGGTAEILIFTSLSVPAASWRQWARDAARSGAPLVLRGVVEGGLPETAKRIGDRLGGAQAGIAIDPRLFRLFGVVRVPTVVVVPGGVPACQSRGCAEDPAPPHDLVTGNIGLAAALETLAGEGDVARTVARRHLERLRGEGQP